MTTASATAPRETARTDTQAEIDHANDLHDTFARRTAIAEGYGVAPEQFTILDRGKIVPSYRGLVAILATLGLEPPPMAKFLSPDEPAAWAPVNRPRWLRDEIDAYRNLRVAPPANVREGMQHLHFALELYEHAVEIEREDAAAYYAYLAEYDVLREQVIAALLGSTTRDIASVIDVGTVTATSRSAAEKVVDSTPTMIKAAETKARFMSDKARAEKEVSVARRRHATAIAAVQAFTFGPTVEYTNITAPTISGVSAAALDACRPDVTAGDTDDATLGGA